MNLAQSVIARFDIAEYRLCRGLNRICAQRLSLRVFQAASRAGDGVAWYALLAVLPLAFGRPGARAALAMAATGLVGVVLYKALKHALVRERPFIRHAGITLAMPPLDRYSFPSGHTLHAACMTWQAVAHFPALAWLLVPFASLVAASRVVLGLHYPSDVVAGAALGIGLAQLGLAFG